MVEVSEPEALEVRLRGVRVAKLFDKKFIGALEQELSGATVGHVCIFIKEEEDDEYNVVYIGHRKPKDEKDKIIYVDAMTPENLTAALKALKHFLKDE